MDKLTIEHASGHQVFLADGEAKTDLVTGFGSVFLGHNRPNIVAAVSGQLNKAWATGRANSSILEAAQKQTQAVLPGQLKYAGLYSTGMEAAEYAMRLAATATGKRHFAGFSGSMHGKSGFTAGLCWENSVLQSPNSHIVDASYNEAADQILSRVESVLRGNPVGALFIEPIQGSNGGLTCPPWLCDQLISLCHQHETLCIFDEILTGLYRTGSRFYSDKLEVEPDLILFAKSMGNGFPVSAVAAIDSVLSAGSALPGSTFSENPLASAAVVATLEEMSSFDIAAAVHAIELATTSALLPLEQYGFTLRGSGALWVLEVPDPVSAGALSEMALQRGVLMSAFGNRIRLLPPATIQLHDYEAALAVLTDICTQLMQ